MRKALWDPEKFRQDSVPGTPQISQQFAEMYSYTQAGLPIKKRLQANENVYYSQSSNHTGTINLDATYTYDNEGKMTSVNYPTTYTVDQNENLIPAAGPTYTYSFDNMHRPVTLTDQNNTQTVNGVTYGAANQLLTMNYFGVSETRTYNSMLQMTRLTIPGQLDVAYTFPSATTNNGKITSQTDNISGEMVTYQYDSLNRLSAGNGSGWNQNFGYDGFGNLVSKTGTNSPTLSVAVDPATNRVVGQSYDFNGNQLTTPTMGGTLAYDAENRLLTAPGVQYSYDAQNKRIWKGAFDSGGNLTGQELYFYGVDGQKLGTYTLMADYTQAWGPVLWESSSSLAVFFGAKRVAVGGVAFVPDRLGSKGKYYPYGEERNSPPLANDQVKFATYTRDSATGLDYADQRYYANTFGRFTTPDPYMGSGGPSDPKSWNRYAYVEGDPLNFTDPDGREIIPAGIFVDVLSGLGLLRSDSVTVTAQFEEVPMLFAYQGGWRNFTWRNLQATNTDDLSLEARIILATVYNRTRLLTTTRFWSAWLGAAMIVGTAGEAAYLYAGSTGGMVVLGLGSPTLIPVIGTMEDLVASPGPDGVRAYEAVGGRYDSDANMAVIQRMAEMGLNIRDLSVDAAGNLRGDAFRIINDERAILKSLGYGDGPVQLADGFWYWIKH